MAQPFFTIGHSTRSIAEFVDILRESGVERVVDVRSMPRSRTNPQFNGPSLCESLAERQIGYEHIAALGGLRGKQQLAAPSLNDNWRVRSFRNYADYALTEPFAAGLARLRRQGAKHRCAIMCAETLWWRCHRRIIADYLLAAGERVLHILGPSEVDEAQLTSGAVVRADNTVVYPAPSPRPGAIPMARRQRIQANMNERFKVGDRVSWNSEAGRVSGTIIRVHTRDVDYKGHTHHASPETPQYEIKSSKTDHIAMHLGGALTRLRG